MKRIAAFEKRAFALDQDRREKEDLIDIKQFFTAHRKPTITDESPNKSNRSPFLREGSVDETKIGSNRRKDTVRRQPFNNKLADAVAGML
jgi:hypothetical protein